jgi:hypothetical protein
MRPTSPSLLPILKRSSYYDSDYRQTAALIRARRPYVFKNAFMGLAIGGFAIGVCECPFPSCIACLAKYTFRKLHVSIASSTPPVRGRRSSNLQLALEAAVMSLMRGAAMGTCCRSSCGRFMLTSHSCVYIKSSRPRNIRRRDRAVRWYCN